MFRLAMGLGKTLEELTENMSSRELTAWMAYYSCEPWGHELEGRRHSVTASTLANVGLMMNNPKKLKSRPFRPDDFFIGGSKLTTKEKERDTRKMPDWSDHKTRLMTALGVK